eukprot:5990655-Prymnesium_polylepis.2
MGDHSVTRSSSSRHRLQRDVQGEPSAAAQGAQRCGGAPPSRGPPAHIRTVLGVRARAFGAPRSSRVARRWLTSARRASTARRFVRRTTRR